VHEKEGDEEEEEGEEGISKKGEVGPHLAGGL